MKGQRNNYVGTVINGKVLASRADAPFITFGRRVPLRHNRWRYVDEVGLVFWSTESSPEERLAVENYLREKGIKVEGHRETYKENYFIEKSDFKKIVKDSIREAFYTPKTVINEVDSQQIRAEKIKDIKNYLKGSLKPIVSETSSDRKFTVVILKNSRIIYIKNNDSTHPVPADYFIGQWTEDYKKFGVTELVWDRLSPEDKASIEVKRQVKQIVKEKYYDLYARFYKGEEYVKWWKEGGYKTALAGHANDYWNKHHPKRFFMKESIPTWRWDTEFPPLRMVINAEEYLVLITKNDAPGGKEYKLDFFKRDKHTGEIRATLSKSWELDKSEAENILKTKRLPDRFSQSYKGTPPPTIIPEQLNEARFSSIQLAVEYYGQIFPAVMLKNKRPRKKKLYRLTFFTQGRNRLVRMGYFDLTEKEANDVLANEKLPDAIEAEHSGNIKVITLGPDVGKMRENLLVEGLFGIRMKVRYAGREYDALISKNTTPHRRRPFVFTSFYRKENEVVPFEQKSLSTEDIQFMLKNYKFSYNATKRFREWGAPEIVSINGKDVSNFGFTFNEELLFLENSVRELELYLENKLPA